jgi:PAS domain S-box-containing protein
MNKLQEWATAHRLPNQIQALIAFEIAFYLAYRYGMSFTSASPAPFWFPDAVVLCALLMSPRSWWWMYFLAILPIRFFVAVPAGTPFWFLVANFLNDSFKGLFSASLLRRGSHEGRWFDDLQGFTKYLLVAVLLSPAISAVAGAWTRVVLGATFWPAWTQWFLGDALASILLTPALFCLMRDYRNLRYRSLARHIESIVMGASLIGIAYLLFGSRTHINYPISLIYLPVPFLIWAAVRFGPFSTCILLSVLSSLATFGASIGRGPFPLIPSVNSVISIQLLLFVLSVPFLFLSVLMQQQSWTESALRDSEQRFRSLVDTVPVLVWISDPQGLCTFFSRPWLEFTGVPIEKQLGNGWSTLVHGEDRDRCVHEYLECVRRQASFNLEYRLLRHDGVYRWVFDHAVPRYGPTGKFIGHIGSCMDITERKGAEEALRRFPRELLNAQEVERQRIAQELHDDLGQRLVALGIGLNGLSQQTVMNKNVRDGIESLRQQATEIITAIASLSRELRPVTLQVLGLAAGLRSLCEELTDPAGVNVVFTQHDELPDIPWTTAISLYRVAQEAVRNALTHSGSPTVNVAVGNSESCITVTIADTGCGFDYGNGNAPVGLGLTGMVERMKNVGGMLTIDSTFMNGTTVTAKVDLKELT